MVSPWSLPPPLPQAKTAQRLALRPRHACGLGLARCFHRGPWARNAYHREAQSSRPTRGGGRLEHPESRGGILMGPQARAPAPAWILQVAQYSSARRSGRPTPSRVLFVVGHLADGHGSCFQVAFSQALGPSPCAGGLTEAEQGPLLLPGAHPPPQFPRTRCSHSSFHHRGLTPSGSSLCLLPHLLGFPSPVIPILTPCVCLPGS